MWICESEIADHHNKAYIVMNKLENITKFDIGTYKKINDILDLMKDKEWLHVDVKKYNIMKKSDGTIVLIDFGWAVNKRDAENIDDRLVYPKHPLSIRYNKYLTWQQLEHWQNYQLLLSWLLDPSP